jgi:outer membrane protein TolC
VAAEKKRLRQQISSEIRQAVTNVVIAQEKVRLQRVNLETAREHRRIVEEQYKHGKETVVRLNDAQRAYVETDASLALSRIQLRQAWTDLRAAAAAIHAEP